MNISEVEFAKLEAVAEMGVFTGTPIQVFANDLLDLIDRKEISIGQALAQWVRRN